VREKRFFKVLCASAGAKYNPRWEKIFFWHLIKLTARAPSQWTIPLMQARFTNHRADYCRKFFKKAIRKSRIERDRA
jgi:hypothetical protein